MTKQQIDALVRDWLSRSLEEAEEFKLSCNITDEQHIGVTLAVTDELERNQLDLTFNRFERIARIADELLEERGLELDRTSPEYRRLCSELLKAEQQWLNAELRRWEGNYSDEFTSQPQTSVTLPDQVPTKSLSKVIDDYIRDKETEKSWRPRTGTMIKSGLRMLLEAVGDKPISEVTKADIRGYKEVLHKLPTNMSVRFPGKAIREVLLLDEVKDVPKLSKSSVDKQLRYVKALFNWAKDNDYIEVNPAEALKLKRQGVASEQRDPFSDEDLALIFSGDFATHRQRRPDRYWIPLIMLHSGARLEEIAQLATKDVREVDGVWCIDITDTGEEQNLKTEESRRLVPIHSWLIQQGLLGYVGQMKTEGHTRLWPQLKKTANGYGSAISKWFNKRLRMLGISNPKKVLYSTRHTVTTRLKYLDVQEYVIAELIGHKVEGISMGRYGKKLKVGKLKNIVELLNFSNAINVNERKNSDPIAPSRLSFQESADSTG